ncbi:MAG TPA: PEP/pyruvate-binding domain-containing protein, partial [Gemmatimonadaceae bacterium]|nr:PEP/pyruvate-binding domain-containing protein [Gemmatimonadaceae bacterium]
MTIATPPNQKSAPPQLKIVLPFAEIGREDVGIVGGKGANLGEMARFGLPVPNGFVATVAAYATFLAHNELSGRIQRLVDGLDVDNTASLQSAAAAVRELILTGEIPAEVRDALVAAYRDLSIGGDAAATVAVRSSATAEDTG